MSISEPRNALNLIPADSQRDPFPHTVFRSVFREEACAAVLDWLELTSAWVLVETDFYEQYEFCVDTVELPKSVAFLQGDGVRDSLCESLATLFGFNSVMLRRVAAHKFIAGQHIGLHNDVIEAGENLRLTIQFNRGLRDSDGGFFMLFNSERQDDVARILKPTNNSALAFLISDCSHHAVSRVYGGTRHTLVFSFDGS